MEDLTHSACQLFTRCSINNPSRWAPDQQSLTAIKTIFSQWKKIEKRELNGRRLQEVTPVIMIFIDCKCTCHFKKLKFTMCVLTSLLAIPLLVFTRGVSWKVRFNWNWKCFTRRKPTLTFQLCDGGSSPDQPSPLGEQNPQGAHCHRGHFLWVISFFLAEESGD